MIQNTSSKVLINRLIFFIVLFACNSISAQQGDTLRVSPMPVKDVFVVAGYFKPPVWATDMNTFQRMAPASQLIKGDLIHVEADNYTSGPVFTNSEGIFMNPMFNRSFYFQGGITLKLKDNEARDFEGPWLRVGINHFDNSYLLAGGHYRSRSSRADTFYLLNNQAVSRDSGVFRNVEGRYRRLATHLEATFLYKVNPKGIISAYGGAGLMAGIQHGGVLEVRSSEHLQIWDSLTVNGGQKVLYGRMGRVSRSSERFAISPGFSFGAFLNVGINVRLGSQYNFFRHLHFNAELKPLLRSESVKVSGWHSSVVLIAAAGLRYDFE